VAGAGSASPAIVIVADDLSSATDCSVQMTLGGYRAVVPLQPECVLPDDVDIVAFDADSRNLTAEQAYAATRSCVEGQPFGKQTVFYKSVDSTLRGNLGAEIEALFDFGHFDAAAVAPAFPTYGRTTSGGIQFLNGVPVHETEFGTDPTTPVRTSAIADRIAEQCARTTALVPLDIQREGSQAVHRSIESDLAAGVTLFIFDAVEEADLARVAGSIGALPLRMLWVGSTGLSRYLPKAIGLRARPARPAFSVPGGPVLIVAGSASETTRRQLDACVSAGDLIEIRVGALPITRGGDEAEAEIARVRSLLDGAVGQASQTVALTLTSTRADIAETEAAAIAQGMTPEQASARLVGTLGRLTTDLVANGTPLKGLVLTGGDTAKTVASALGAEAIEILDQIEPGIPLGRITGRHDMLMVTKAGGFGSEASLAKSVERIRSYGRD
jgi:uncharacterized protein YgbK (DUF1537 family)